MANETTGGSSGSMYYLADDVVKAARELSDLLETADRELTAGHPDLMAQWVGVATATELAEYVRVSTLVGSLLRDLEQLRRLPGGDL